MGWRTVHFTKQAPRLAVSFDSLPAAGQKKPGGPAAGQVRRGEIVSMLPQATMMPSPNLLISKRKSQSVRPDIDIMAPKPEENRHVHDNLEENPVRG